MAAAAASQEDDLAVLKDLGPSEILLRYQRLLLETVSVEALTVAEKSRRIGYTWGMAAHSVTVAAAQRAAGGMDVFYIAYEKEMTREFIDTCATWAKHFNMAASDVEETLWKDGKDDEGILAFRIIFASGFEIVALSSSPRGLRGRQGLVIIDEAAFHDDLDELLKAALALLMWGGRVVVISTHNGASNPFNRLLEDIRSKRRKGAAIRVTLDDALADGLFKRICQRKGDAWTAEAEAKWRQDVVDYYGDAADEELFCIPRASGGQWLPRPLIEARMEVGIPIARLRLEDDFLSPQRSDAWRAQQIQEFIDREIAPALQAIPPELFNYFGQDFARSSDLSVIFVMSLLPSLVRRTNLVVEMSNVPFAEQQVICFYIIKALRRFQKGAFDATGNGAAHAEAARREFGEERIEEIKLSQEWYRVNMPDYKAAFEGSSIILPKDALILTDHEQFILDRGIAQLRPVRTQSQGGVKRHGDSGIAGALCHYASRSIGMDVGYQAARHPAGFTRTGLSRGPRAW